MITESAVGGVSLATGAMRTVVEMVDSDGGDGRTSSIEMVEVNLDVFWLTAAPTMTMWSSGIGLFNFSQ
jgi:hypothetical protein